MFQFPRIGKSIVRLLSIVVAFVVALGAFTAAKDAGLLSPLGLRSDSSDRQVVQAVERIQEVALVGLNVQGIAQKEQSGTFFGHDIPGTSRTSFLEYKFTAKLGLDGSEVRVERASPTRVRIVLPEFSFIGYDQPTFRTAVEDGGVLSWATEDIDQVEMVNDILDGDARAKYLEQNQAALRDQAKVFYESLVVGVDPKVRVTVEYAE